MTLLEYEDRLVAVNAKANNAVVWQADGKVWAETSAEFAGKAWAEGKELTAEQAKDRFPEADLDAIPAIPAG